MKFKLLTFSTLAVLLVTAVCGFGQNAPASATLKEAYVPLPGGARAIYGSAGTLQYYRHTDGLGNTTLVSPSAAPFTATTSVNTAPFGEDFDDSCGTCTNSMYDFGFSNMGQDNATQGGISAGYGALYGTPNRTYSAVQGRWLSPDPIVNGNAYVYASNAPTANSDPTGLQDGWDCSWDNSCDVWFVWNGGWGDSSWWGWDGWGWGWGDPSYLTPDLTGGNGGWWSSNASVQSPASYFVNYLAQHPYDARTYGNAAPTGTIEAVVPVYTTVHGARFCLSGCSTYTNAGETAEMRTQRYLDNFMQTVAIVAGMFNGSVFETEAVTSSPFNFSNLQGAAVEWQEVERLPEEYAGVYKGDDFGANPKSAYHHYYLENNGEESFSMYFEDLDHAGLTKVSNHYGYLGRDGTFAGSTSNFSLRGLDGKLIVSPNEFKVVPRSNMWVSHAYYNDMQEWGAIKFKYTGPKP